MAGRTSPDKPGSPTPTTARPGKMSPDSLAALTRSNRYTSMVPASDLQTWSNTFKMFDRDGGGDVDHNELGLMFRQLGFTPSDEVMRALTEEVDEDGSGSIDFEEFCLLMLRLRRAQRCPEWLNDLFCPPDEDEVDEHGKPLVAVETAVLSRPHKRGPLPGEAGPHPPLTSEQLYMVGDLLPQSPSLKSLKLAGYGELVGPFLAEEIARGIGRSNRTLTALSLACDKIGDVGAEALAAALAPGRNETLTSLDLAGNEIGEIGAVALLGALKAAISPPISPPAAEKAAADAKPKSSEKRRPPAGAPAAAPAPAPAPAAAPTAAEASAASEAAAPAAVEAKTRCRRFRRCGSAHSHTECWQPRHCLSPAAPLAPSLVPRSAQWPRGLRSRLLLASLALSLSYLPIASLSTLLVAHRRSPSQEAGAAAPRLPAARAAARGQPGHPARPPHRDRTGAAPTQPPLHPALASRQQRRRWRRRASVGGQGPTSSGAGGRVEARRPRGRRHGAAGDAACHCERHCPRRTARAHPAGPGGGPQPWWHRSCRLRRIRRRGCRGAAAAAAPAAAGHSGRRVAFDGAVIHRLASPIGLPPHQRLRPRSWRVHLARMRACARVAPTRRQPPHPQRAAARRHRLRRAGPPPDPRLRSPHPLRSRARTCTRALSHHRSTRLRLRRERR